MAKRFSKEGCYKIATQVKLSQQKTFIPQMIMKSGYGADFQLFRRLGRRGSGASTDFEEPANPQNDAGNKCRDYSYRKFRDFVFQSYVLR